MSRVHLLALPHTETVRVEYDQCAFTGKIRRLADMLTGSGHEVILYASERNDAEVAEHVVCWGEEDRRRWFGDETWANRTFDRWDPNDPCWAESNAGIVDELAERIGPEDFIACPIGSIQSAVTDAFPGYMAFESGIGYEGSWLPHRVYESYAWLHHTYGRQGIHDGHFFDTVIPNAFDESEFYCRAVPDDYLLFLGRHIDRKGTKIVEEIAKRHKVVSAGQGNPIPGVEYLGVVRGQERADLLAGARALLAPTIYIEPFGGVAVEAMLSGVPVIATPWGAFSETVDYLSGSLCYTLSDFLNAVEKCDSVYRPYIRERAVGKWSLDAVAPLYDAYLKRLSTLRGSGWYELGGT